MRTSDTPDGGVGATVVVGGGRCRERFVLVVPADAGEGKTPVDVGGRNGR